jgi:peptidoglycan/xylan/chitin deacetylase (PgdA/CDA1 family)
MSSDAPVRRRSRLLTGDHVAVRSCRLAARTALLSLDYETDYGTGRVEALSHAARFLDVLAELGLPLTAFVEGRLFERHPDRCALLLERGVDVQLHVYDHATDGDTADSLRRGFDAFCRFVGRPPEGYRAHTYRLTPAVYEALVALDFRWDSSVMRAWGLGHNGHRAFRDGDYFVLGDRLVEFPVGSWRYVQWPLNHPYTLVAGRPGAGVLARACGPRGALVAYNAHLTDLFRCGSLASSGFGPLLKLAERWIWRGQGGDTLACFRRMCDYLRAGGFTFRTTSDLYRLLRESGRLQAP